MSNGPIETTTKPRPDALADVLGSQPDAFIAAVDANGLFVPIPESVPRTTQRVIDARSAVDIVVSEHRVDVIHAWERAMITGGATTPIRLKAYPDQLATLEFFDVRPLHGVLITLIHGFSVHDADQIEEGGESLPPRLARARKTGTALFLEVDDALVQILGWTRAELIGNGALTIVHPDDHQRAIASWMQMLETPGGEFRVRLRHRTADQRWVWMEVTNHNRLNPDGSGDVAADMIDISDEMEVQETLRARQELLDRLAEALPLGIAQVIQDGRVSYANGRLHEIFGLPAVESLEQIVARLAPWSGNGLRTALERVLRTGQGAEVELHVEPADGVEGRHCRASIRALTDTDGGRTGIVMSVEDVTDSARMQAELEHRATHDLLTGLRNRGSVIAALESTLRRPDRRRRHDGACRAAIFIDLDGFKAINDRDGHLAGDDVLRAVAARLIGAVRATDVIGRMGGDEFLVVCPVAASPSQAMAVAERIASAIRAPIQVGSGTITVASSIGVACTRPGQETTDALVARADRAMYKSKAAGTGRPWFDVEQEADGLASGAVRKAVPGGAAAVMTASRSTTPSAIAGRPR